MTKDDGMADPAEDGPANDVVAQDVAVHDEPAGGEVTDVDGTAAEPDGGTEEFDDGDATHPDAKPRRSPFARLLVPIALTVLLLASAGLASWVYVTQYRPDQQTDAAVTADTIKAASDGTLALLSYAPDTLDKDFANAKTHLTGDFLSYYTQFTQDIVTPAAKQKSVKTSAAVVNAAVAELNPGSATVLVFLNQTTTSQENPDGSFTASSVKVGLTKVNNTWLISAFDPV